MTFRKSCNIEAKGFILLDVLIALSLSLVFIVAITGASEYSRDIFAKAKEKNEILDAYEAALALGWPQNVWTPYGNDREEMSTTTLISVRALPGNDMTVPVSTALCSVDFSDGSSVGSYEWMQRRIESPSSYSLTASITTYALNMSAVNLPTDLEVRNDIVYVSADSNVASDPDILVFRLGKNGATTLVSSINTGPGASSIAVAGRYIYAAVPSTAAELHVLSQDSAHNLSLVKKYQLPLPYATATPALGSSIAYAAGKIFLGTEKWDGDEFSVVDVANPASPSKIAGIEMGSRVSDVYSFDSTAYLTSAAEQQLRLVSIRDQAHPIVVADFSPSGWQRQEGETVSVFEGGIDFGRTSGGYNVISDHEAFVFATTDPPTASFDMPAFKSVDMPGGVYGIISDRSHEYVITRQSGSEFRIFDRSVAASSSSKHFVAVIAWDADLLQRQDICPFAYQTRNI